MITRVLLACGLALVTIGASCSETLDVRQPVRPAPKVDCLAQALQSSQDVALVRRPIYHYGYSTIDFAVYDSTAKADRRLRLKDGQRLAQLGRQGGSPDGDRTPGDTVILQFAWEGNNGPQGANVSGLTALAVRVLRHVQERCAAAEGTAPVCSLQGRRIPCSAQGE